VNKSQSLFVFCILATLNLSAVRKVNIVNQATTPVRVDLTIPGRTEAQIQLKAIQRSRQFNPNAQALLLKAIANDSKEEIMRAIRIGADVNYVQGGMSPLLMAILLKKDEALLFLMEQGAQPNKTMFEYAASLGYIKMAYLLARIIGLDINGTYCFNSTETTLLQYAINNAIGCNGCNTSCDIVRTTLNEGVNDYYEVIAMLIKDGAQCDDNTTAHFCAVLPPNKAMPLLQELINRGYNPSSYLSHSVIYSSEEILRLVLKNGANPNHVFAVGNIEGSICTPLFNAIMDGASQSIIEILLNAGADINQKANPYPGQWFDTVKTPLACAIFCRRQDIVELLVRRGATLE
jgi:ankyrin repeat protein